MNLWVQTQPARCNRSVRLYLPLKSILKSREIILSDVENPTHHLSGYAILQTLRYGEERR